MNRSGPAHSVRRAALLLAALLHLFGVAAGPALHGWLSRDPHAAGWSPERSELAAAPHDEQACAVCQTASARWLPAEPPAALALTSAAPAVEEVSLPLFRSRVPVHLRARAPPVSIV
jgi:hypothetical protein